jgi:hypothetical protein
MLEAERENALQASGSRRSAGLVDANDLADVFVLVLGGINRLRDVICDLYNREHAPSSSTHTSLVTPAVRISLTPKRITTAPVHWIEHSDGKAPA